VRSSAAGADDREPLGAERVGQRQDVRHAVGDRAAGQPGRLGVPGPGVRRDPHPDLAGCRDEVRREIVALRRAVDADNERAGAGDDVVEKRPSRVVSMP
jgi:hypothetical protein